MQSIVGKKTHCKMRHASWSSSSAIYQLYDLLRKVTEEYWRLSVVICTTGIMLPLAQE